MNSEDTTPDDARPDATTSAERASQLSAMFDSELPDAECELVARRLARDDQLKDQWSRYALIGAVIREEPLRARRSAAGVMVGSGVAGRVAQTLELDEAAAAGEGGRAAGGAAAGQRGAAVARWARPVAGLGIAAGVAALSVLWLQSRTQALDPAVVLAGTVVPADGRVVGAWASAGVEIVVAPPSLVDARPPGDTSGTSGTTREPRSYVVPMPSSQTPALTVPQLANYVVAHSEFSGPMARRSTLSALIAADSASEPAADAAAAAR